MRGVAAHRLLLLRLTDSRSANHMCAPPTSTSAPLSSAFTFPPPWLCPPLSSRAPRIPTVPPRVAVCLASALYTLCAKPSPMHPSGFVATACNKRDDMAIATAPARVHANEVSFLSPCVLLARPTAPPSHLSIPFPPLLHRVLSARARASAHERRACARANTRNNAVDKHRTRAKLLRARARARSRAQAFVVSIMSVPAALIFIHRVTWSLPRPARGGKPQPPLLNSVHGLAGD